jgi:F420-non-reducing hydrogenase large subunit
MSKEITIHPVTRLEGHGKISIFLNDSGEVDDAYYQVIEFRGFERFCKGRPVEEMPLITPRICGVCPWAHHMAAARAADAVYKVKIPTTAQKLRELAYHAFYVHDHSAVFYALSSPDFVLGPTASKTERNIIGVASKVGVPLVKYILDTRLLATRILEILGGRAVHPTMTVIGGVGKRLSEEDRMKIVENSEKLLELGKKTLDIFEDVVLKNEEYVKIITGDIYKHATYYMGLVDDKDKINYYDGKLKVVDPEGKTYARFDASEYLQHLAEHIEPWTYLKFPYLKNVVYIGLGLLQELMYQTDSQLP